MSEVVRIPKGTRVYLGAPANPMPEEVVQTIIDSVSTDPNIVEAHLPQCFVADLMKTPGQVLFLVLASKRLESATISSITERLNKAPLSHGSIDIFPLDVSHELYGSVRNSGCQIYKKS